MAIVDTKTSNRNYPVPTAPNFIEDDFPRVATALSMIDADIAALMTSVAQRSLIGHTHQISDVTGLQAALNGKVAVGTTYTLAGLSDVSGASGAASKQVLKFVGDKWQPGFVDWSEITNPPNVTTVFGGSGTLHSIGLVPDPGATAGTSRVLRENGTWGNITSTDVTTALPPASARTTFGLDGYVFRNRLRNTTFAINQRGVSGTVTLSSGQYGHDGVKGGASGGTYTFSTSGLDTTLTISAGSLILPVEANLIEGGAYVLSHAGTAQARVWQGTGSSGSGAYAPATTAAPLTLTGLSAATQTNVEFSTGTVLRPQLEPGNVATAFERRPFDYELGLCQRYFFSSLNDGVAPGTATNNSAYEAALASGIAASGYGYAQALFPKKMRANPTVVFYDMSGAQGKVTVNGTSYSAVPVDIFQIGFGAYQNTSSSSWTAGTSIKFNFTASAEI